MALAVLLCAAVASVARAQDDAPRADDARVAYVAGIEAASDSRWDQARAHFERSYRLEPSAAALYNLATALRALGRHREARDQLDLLLAEHAGAGADVLAAARTMRAEEQAQLATVVLDVDGPPVTVRVDGREQEDTGARPLEVEVDAGARALDVSRPGHLTFHWSDAVAAGEVRTIDVELVPVEEEPGVLASPWFWAGTGALAVGAVVLVVVVASSDGGIQPSSPVVLRP